MLEINNKLIEEKIKQLKKAIEIVGGKEYLETFKNDNVIIIPYKNNNLVDTVKEMIISKKLDFSYALSFVDINKLREEMESFAIDFSYYDEFDKLEDDLEECLNKFFRYNDSELYEKLI